MTLRAAARFSGRAGVRSAYAGVSVLGRDKLAAMITVAGIVIPSDSTLFLAIVGAHVLVALACVIAGAVAMLSRKGRGRHSRFGTGYYWLLCAVFASATALSAARWAEDDHLFVLGALALAAATFGRTALRRRWRGWVRMHIAGMGTSYVLLLVAFYVDNGRNLPLWRDLPPASYWLLPVVAGAPIIVRALLRHPRLKQT